MGAPEGPRGGISEEEAPRRGPYEDPGEDNSVEVDIEVGPRDDHGGSNLEHNYSI